MVAPLPGLPLLLHEGMQVALTPPSLERDRFCTVLSVDDRRAEPLVAFSSIGSISDAESIQGCMVLAHGGDLDLPPLVRPYDELMGRCVIDERYGELGTIREILSTPANDVWIVDGAAYGEVLVPVIPDVLGAIPASGPIPSRVMDGLIDAASMQPDGSPC